MDRNGGDGAKRKGELLEEEMMLPRQSVRMMNPMVDDDNLIESKINFRTNSPNYLGAKSRSGREQTSGQKENGMELNALTEKEGVHWTEDRRQIV